MAAPAVHVSATRIQRAVRRRFYLKWVVVDTETAALHGAVIQVAVVGLSARLSPLLEYREYWSNVDSSIDPRAEAVHHISAEDLRAKGQCPTRGLSRLQRLLRSNKHRGDVTFVAHNAIFDLHRLVYTARELGVAPLDPSCVLCTMKASKDQCGLTTKTGRAKLPTNAELYSYLFPDTPLPHGPLHDALVDVKLTSASFVEGHRRGMWDAFL